MKNKEYWLIQRGYKGCKLIDKVIQINMTKAREEFLSRNKLNFKKFNYIISESIQWIN
jgi:hypothetical protein